jgi:hypothetical protein
VRFERVQVYLFADSFVRTVCMNVPLMEAIALHWDRVQVIFFNYSSASGGLLERMGGCHGSRFLGGRKWRGLLGRESRDDGRGEASMLSLKEGSGPRSQQCRLQLGDKLKDLFAGDFSAGQAFSFWHVPNSTFVDVPS